MLAYAPTPIRETEEKSGTEITVVVLYVYRHKKIRLREFYKFLDKAYYFFRPCLICWLLFAHHHNRAVSVADNGIGDATQQRSP